MSRHAYHTQYRRHDGPGRGRRRWTDRLGLRVLRNRWRNRMPKFFKRLFKISTAVCGTATAATAAINAAGLQPHEWWLDLAPYIIGTSAGIAFASKLTQTYDKDGNPTNPDFPDADQPSAVNMSDVETTHCTQND